MLIDFSAVKAHRSAAGGKRGGRNQALGRSCGGLTTKIYALTDRDGRPIAFPLTGGQVEENGTMSNIPPKTNRRWKNCFSLVLYRDRNATERMFCRLKDCRRVATRYDRDAVNFLVAVCIAATVSSWL